ncbi:MAG: hypothetical protein JWL92_292 [Candidatus Nomurabacteria bacterium]|nr:hypothetical protein [Candidatus Nomurabacteria bacterium]
MNLDKALIKFTSKTHTEMKNVLLTIAFLVVATVAFAQTTVESPYVAINKRTNAKVLVVPQPPTATVTCYANGDRAILNDSVIRFAVKYNNEVTVWEQKPSHQPKLLYTAGIAKKDLMAKN